MHKYFLIFLTILSFSSSLYAFSDAEIIERAKQGYAEDQLTLAVMYKEGVGVQKNMAEAIKWFEKAANQENTDALFMLGAIYQNGMGVSVNLNKAANLYQKASNKGDI
ncbi:tetratricopeptide repeat protein, partial [Acinetobacter sp. YH16042]